MSLRKVVLPIWKNQVFESVEKTDSIVLGVRLENSEIIIIELIAEIEL